MIGRFAIAVALVVAAPVAAQDRASQDGATISMTAALTAARAELPGSVLEAELERKDGARVYEIDLLHEGALHQLVVDARSGAVLSNTKRTLAGLWHRWFSYNELKAAQAAEGTLLQSVATAERAAGGRATGLSLDEEHGRWVYEIDVDGARDVAFDARSGEMLTRGRASGSDVTSGAKP